MNLLYISPMKIDIDNLATLFASEKFTAVIHLAAQTLVPYSLKKPAEDCDINLLGLINILECCRLLFL